VVHESISEFNSMPENNHSAERYWLIALVLVTATICFGSLNAPLVEPTEARYALIAADMLENDSWFIPYLNGEPYLDKPPLLYWAIMSVYRLFGITDATARLVPTICSLGTIIVSWFWLRTSAGNRAALLATSVLVLSPRAMYYMEMVAMDAPIGFAVTATIASLHMALGRERLAPLWLISATLATLVGVLSKGPVILVVTLVPAGLALLVTHTRKRLVWLGIWFTAAILGSGLCFLWLERMSPGFCYHFLFRHNLERFATPFDHEGPWWYHLPGTWLGALPWTLLIPFVWWKNRAALSLSASQTTIIWLSLSFLTGLIFFSIAGSKRASYCTAFLPQGCLVLGLLLDKLLPSGWSELSRRNSVGAAWLTWLGCAPVMALPIIGYVLDWCSYQWIPIMACIAVLGFAAAIVLGSRWDLGMAMAAIAVLFGQTVLLSGHHEHFSPRKAIRWLSKHQPDAIFACYPHAFESMAFYVDNKELIIFETGQEAELADFLKQKPNAVLAAKGNKLPTALTAAIEVTLKQATPFKATPWLMKLPEPSLP